MLIGLLTGVASTQAIAAETAMSRSHQFVLPVTYPSQDDVGQQYAATRLYVSKDRGVSWQVAATGAGNLTQFPVQANNDGHYWFAIRRLTPQGAVFPRATIDADFQVLVDTTPPTLRLSTERLSATHVRITVLAADLALLPSTLELQYQSADPLATWTPLPVRRESVSMENGQLHAVVPCHMNTAFAVTLRASIWDKVGFKGVQDLKLGPASTQPQILDLSGQNVPQIGGVLPQASQTVSASANSTVTMNPTLSTSPATLTTLAPTKIPQRLIVQEPIKPIPPIPQNQILTTEAASRPIVWEATSRTINNRRPAPSTDSISLVEGTVDEQFPTATLGSTVPAPEPTAAEETVSSVTEQDLLLFEKLMSSQPRNVRLREAFAEALQSRQDFHRAELEWKKILTLQPDHPSAKAQLVICLRSQNRTMEANQLLSESPNLP